MYKVAQTLILGAAIALVGCGDSADNNTTNNTTPNNGGTNNVAPNNIVANNMTTNTQNNATTGDVSFADDVVPIFAANGCAVAGCHLDPGNQTSFVVADPAGAAEFQAGFEGVMTAGGRALVVGGDLDNSELYLRVTGTGVAQMPFGGSLTPDEIATVTAWIDGGAAF